MSANPKYPKSLTWTTLSNDPLVYESLAGPRFEYHVTVADDGEIRGQKCFDVRQIWVSDVAQSYDEAKRFCEAHYAEYLEGISNESPAS